MYKNCKDCNTGRHLHKKYLQMSERTSAQYIYNLKMLFGEIEEPEAKDGQTNRFEST
jgi:hypothetical protein